MSEFNPTDTGAREAELHEQVEAEKLRAMQEAADIEWLMGDARGRRIVWGLLSVSGVFRTSYTGDNGTFFNEGKRNIGLVYMAKVNDVCPEKYGDMLMEQQA